MGFVTAALVNSLRLNQLGRPRFSSLFYPFHQGGRRDGITSIYMNIHRISTVAEAEDSDFECEELHDDVKATEKETALRLALSRVAGDFGSESMLSLQRFFSTRRAPVISTGSLKLDVALGIGGLPKGRIVEIYGQEASGKTTLALHVIKEAQKLGGYCVYLDVENAMDPSLAESMGVSLENLLISHPSSAENSLSMVNTLTRSGAVDVIVVDSVAALVPQSELDHMVGETLQDLQPQIMTKALRKINYSLCQSQTLILFLNQIRSGLRCGRMEEVTCGGNALKFYAAVRLKMTRKRLLEINDKVTGLGVSVQVVKNNLAPAMKKAELEIQFGRGFRCESEALELACEHGIIFQEGSNYLLDGKIFRDEHEAEKYLAENDGILDKIVMILRKQLLERKENDVKRD